MKPQVHSSFRNASKEQSQFKVKMNDGTKR